MSDILRDDHLLPILRHGSAVLLFSLGTFLVVVFTVLVTRAAERSAIASRMRVLAPFVVGAFLAIWLGTAAAVVQASSALAGLNRLRLITLAVGFGPMVVAMALLWSSKTIRDLDAAMPPGWLVRVQAYRMAGLVFFPFLFFGLPAGFVIPAAVGDFLTGVLALLVASAIERGRPNALAWGKAWNAFGILDLIVAPIAAVLSQARLLGHYPLWLVPLFIGPPIGILTHVYSLRNLRFAARAPSTR